MNFSDEGQVTDAIYTNAYLRCYGCNQERAAILKYRYLASSLKTEGKWTLGFLVGTLRNLAHATERAGGEVYMMSTLSVVGV